MKTFCGGRGWSRRWSSVKKKAGRDEEDSCGSDGGPTMIETIQKKTNGQFTKLFK